MVDILIVEDNIELANILKDFLEIEKYSVLIATSGEAALDVIKTNEVKMVILDIMLPKMDGFEVCFQIRTKNNVPIIILSAKNTKDDKINGLILGADDYLEKPYDIDILIAKIKGIFKRRYEQDIIVDRNFKIDKLKRLFYRNDELVFLNNKEFDLILIFIENKNKTMTKEHLFNKIWGYDSFSELQTLTVHIKWLREKIEEDPKNPKHLKTIWGIGYRYE